MLSTPVLKVRMAPFRRSMRYCPVPIPANTAGGSTSALGVGSLYHYYETSLINFTHPVDIAYGGRLMLLP